MKDSKENIIQLITNYLEKKEEIIYAYIFGSFVQRKFYHDVDIAVFIKPDFNYKDFDKYCYGYESEVIAKLEHIIREKVDFVIINKANLTIQKNILKTNILLFDKNKYQRVSFENSVRKKYIDAEKIRRIKKTYFSKKIENA